MLLTNMNLHQRAHMTCLQITKVGQQPFSDLLNGTLKKKRLQTVFCFVLIIQCQPDMHFTDDVNLVSRHCIDHLCNKMYKLTL